MSVEPTGPEYRKSKAENELRLAQIAIHFGEDRALERILLEHLAYEAHIWGPRNDRMRAAHREVFGYDYEPK